MQYLFLLFVVSCLFEFFYCSSVFRLFYFLLFFFVFCCLLVLFVVSLFSLFFVLLNVLQSFLVLSVVCLFWWFVVVFLCVSLFICHYYLLKLRLSVLSGMRHYIYKPLLTQCVHLFNMVSWTSQMLLNCLVYGMKKCVLLLRILKKLYMSGEMSIIVSKI